MRIQNSEFRIQNPETRWSSDQRGSQRVSGLWSVVCGLLFVFCGLWSVVSAEQPSKASEVIAAAVEAMGGNNYLGIKNYHKVGRYFSFDNRGRSGFTPFMDWTVFEPIKWRFQLGKDKRRHVQIYNLEIGKGWILEGKSSVAEIPEEEIKDFKKDVQGDIDILLRDRVDEEGMSLFYYGPDDISGSGEFEAVDFLDASNKSIVIFFDLESHLPLKMETHIINSVGVRLKQETEFGNWHTIQGVHTPLRSDHYTDGEMSRQIFIEEITFNGDIPPEYFLEPVLEK